ncbi:hypothetical protein D9C73_014450 [Collichthys lucidus]|uniref:Uncharacterized protein n=1 Tax=Collichthys lucidus TaxID=240159 RepID=A0A4U5UX98_COLLU|nr:hypothetical protein D9C73_014450 [Collichthys lucidus]
MGREALRAEDRRVEPYRAAGTSRWARRRSRKKSHGEKSRYFETAGAQRERRNLTCYISNSSEATYSLNRSLPEPRYGITMRALRHEMAARVEDGRPGQRTIMQQKPDGNMNTMHSFHYISMRWLASGRLKRAVICHQASADD